MYKQISVSSNSIHQALNEEYKSKGIIVQCVKPGFVATKLSGIKRPSLLAPTPHAFVKSALATVGELADILTDILAASFEVVEGCEKRAPQISTELERNARFARVFAFMQNTVSLNNNLVSTRLFSACH